MHPNIKALGLVPEFIVYKMKYNFHCLLTSGVFFSNENEDCKII